MGFGGRIQRWHVDFQLAYSVLFLGGAPGQPGALPRGGVRLFQRGYQRWVRLLAKPQQSVGCARRRRGERVFFARHGNSPDRQFRFRQRGRQSPLAPPGRHFRTSAAWAISASNGNRAAELKRGVSLAPGLMLGYQFGLGQPQWRLSDVLVHSMRPPTGPALPILAWI
jgi:hypothetical protein